MGTKYNPGKKFGAEYIDGGEHTPNVSASGLKTDRMQSAICGTIERLLIMEHYSLHT